MCVCVCPVCPAELSHLSRPYVPSVPRTFCPLNWDFHINRAKCPGCPWDVPNLSLGRFQGIPTTKFLYVIFLYQFLSLSRGKDGRVLWSGPPDSQAHPLHVRLGWMGDGPRTKNSREMTGEMASVENAPTCYRAPKWPDPEFPQKIPKKNTPRPEILDSQNLPPKYPENTEKIPQNTKNARFWYFFGIFSVFGGIFLGFQNFCPRGIFSVFFVEIPGRAISGLCSRSGRSYGQRAIP